MWSNNKEKSALIAMSGGVDSSVAAYLMQQRGFRCEGTTMRLYRNADIGLSQFHTCCSQRDIDDAAEVAFQLDIPYEVLDFTMDFKSRVIEKFIRIYESGGTPNPCIDCNRYMKFDSLLRFAEEKGLETIVTGHYARVEYDSGSGRYLLKKALDLSKDQSYVLYSLTQDQLSRTLFPLGGLHKTETRRIAEEQGFINAEKRDSQDICFIPDGDYAGFIEKYTGRTYPSGYFTDREGNILGEHRGIIHYTIGQRKGLGLALKKPMYVQELDMERNRVILGDNADLFTREFDAKDFNWIATDTPASDIRAKARIRYKHKEADATIVPTGPDTVHVIFDEPQRAITRGQSVVLYDGDYVIGGGTIC